MTTTMPAVRAPRAPSLSANKRETAKPSKAKTVALATVTKAQFDQALRDAVSNAKQGFDGLRLGCIFVAQQTTYQAQSKAIDAVAKAYAQVAKIIDGAGKEMSSDTARKWVKRNAEKLYPSFKILKSESQQAEQKRKARAKKGANANKGKGKAEAKPAETKAPAFKVLTVAQMKQEISNVQENLYDTLKGSIPAGNLKDFAQLQAAFYQSAIKLLTAKAE